ncbi:hypothetical protein LOTGIDRAFT_152903 [Lottia gigantea]|uniref:IgGFc-binding protein N-terminal domain-containing protein n=1 Tax=Lottia gigantea TaxID=225164 RepID=V4A1U6_LOTGI|nr:hypothetical protein LOTGIDRAFT_152903 [Lottia gigantea]ESO97803.1 hypothetical protein LOTGIDRAFT_152903 [Lottia gigantea]
MKSQAGLMKQRGGSMFNAILLVICSLFVVLMMAEGGDSTVDELVVQFQTMLSGLSPANRDRVILSLIPTESEALTLSVRQTELEQGIIRGAPAVSAPEYPLYPLGDILDIRLAGGHSLLYSGYIEVPFHIPFSSLYISALFLVIPSSRVNREVPIVIGTNILDRIPSEDIQGLDSSWKSAISFLNTQKGESFKVFPVKTNKSVRVYPNSTTFISCSANVSSPVPGCHFFVSNDISTPSSLHVLPDSQDFTQTIDETPASSEFCSLERLKSFYKQNYEVIK